MSELLTNLTGVWRGQGSVDLPESIPQATENEMEEAARSFGRALKKLLSHPTWGNATIRWSQFTPWFNDGSPCEFSFHGLELLINGYWYTFGNYGGRTYLDCYTDGPHLDRLPSWLPVRDLEDFVLNHPNDAELAMLYERFGDHCSVTVTKEGCVVEEYAHD